MVLQILCSAPGYPVDEFARLYILLKHLGAFNSCMQATRVQNMLQRDAMVAIGVAAQKIAGKPKRHPPRRRADPRARTNNTEQEHTSNAQSSPQRQEAHITHRSGGCLKVAHLKKKNMVVCSECLLVRAWSCLQFTTTCTPLVSGITGAVCFRASDCHIAWQSLALAVISGHSRLLQLAAAAARQRDATTCKFYKAMIVPYSMRSAASRH